MAAVWYVAGLATLPALSRVLRFALWAFSKTLGGGGCRLDWCRHKALEQGEHFNIAFRARALAHRWLLMQTPKHRRALDAYWQDRKDQGRWVHPDAAKRLK